MEINKWIIGFTFPFKILCTSSLLLWTEHVSHDAVMQVQIQYTLVDFPHCYLHHRRWMDVMFSPLSVCPFVCFIFFVCKQDISKSCARIRMKFGGELGYVTTMNWFNFGEDLVPDLDLDPRILKVIFHHWEKGPKTRYSTISPNVAVRFVQNLVGMLGV